mmetsp:Transcript_16348/g.53426  ORF Transcript_16348/g.53426 Transcript_16348/m.53426 type:complete len:251 (-) Transcript_16348:2-754(-)
MLRSSDRWRPMIVCTRVRSSSDAATSAEAACTSAPMASSSSPSSSPPLVLGWTAASTRSSTSSATNLSGSPTSYTAWHGFHESEPVHSAAGTPIFSPTNGASSQATIATAHSFVDSPTSSGGAADASLAPSVRRRSVVSASILFGSAASKSSSCVSFSTASASSDAPFASRATERVCRSITIARGSLVGPHARSSDVSCDVTPAVVPPARTLSVTRFGSPEGVGTSGFANETDGPAEAFPPAAAKASLSS